MSSLRGPPRRGLSGPYRHCPEPGPPRLQPPMVYDPQKLLRSVSSARPWATGAKLVPARARQRQIDCACAALILRLIRPSFSSPGFLAAFKLSHKIYLLFHEYISSRQAQAFYIFTLYIFHGRLIAVSKAERGRGRESEQTEPAAGGRGREAVGDARRAGGDEASLVPTAMPGHAGLTRGCLREGGDSLRCDTRPGEVESGQGFWGLRAGAEIEVQVSSSGM